MQSGNEDATAEIARLKRRLDRERNARLQAESIAEKGLRELYSKQQQLQLLEKIATAANRTSSIDEILQFAIAQICAFTGWEVGHAYLAVGGGDAARLQSTRIWHAADPARIEDFRRVTEEMEFESGIGLPGRVLAESKPLWIVDVADDDNFPRLRYARKCGLKGASAFPVLLGRDVVAVVEFFADIAREPDEALLDLMAQIGLQLGRAIERHRADDLLRRRAEELALARDEARAADRAKSAFLASMSHELRTPLNAIIGFSALIRDAVNGPIDGEYREYAKDINESGQHLQDIINDILDISKLEVGRMELREEAVSIPDSLDACRRLLRPAAESGGVSLLLDLPVRLPLVRSDEVRFKQILLNLMSNAVKFTPGGGEVCVSVSTGADGILVAVKDTGIGIKPENIAVALEPFRQIDGNLNRRYDGTGLGLPLTKALVELHGGRLEIESVWGLGTTVWVRLPPDRVIDAAA